VYISGAHLMACGYVFIANREAARAEPTRFDGQYFYQNLLNRKFVTLPPILEMPTWDRYVMSMYMSSSMMGAIMYGDSIPLAYTE